MKPVVLVVRRPDRFSSLLNENDFETINLALIKTIRADDLTEFERKIAALDDYDGIFLTSPAAADVFLEKLSERKFGGKIYVLGGRIRRLFEERGIETVYRAEANTIEEFLKSFPPREFAGKKFLFPRGDRSLRTIPVTLKAAAIDETVVYKTIRPEIDRAQTKRIEELFGSERIKAVCFFSPSGIDNFLETFKSFRQKNIKIAVIGATTARAAESKNLNVDFVSSASNVETFALELVEHLKNID